MGVEVKSETRRSQAGVGLSVIKKVDERNGKKKQQQRGEKQWEKKK